MRYANMNILLRLNISNHNQDKYTYVIIAHTYDIIYYIYYIYYEVD